MSKIMTFCQYKGYLFLHDELIWHLELQDTPCLLHLHLLSMQYLAQVQCTKPCALPDANLDADCREIVKSEGISLILMKSLSATEISLRAYKRSINPSLVPTLYRPEAFISATTAKTLFRANQTGLIIK